MTREKLWNAVTAAVLAMLLAAGAVGGMMTGFDLKMAQSFAPIMVGAVFAIIAAVCFSYRFGELIMAGILAVAALFFWQGGNALDQILALITRLTYEYDQAYHFGMLSFGGAWYGVAADLPMMILAALVATAVAWSVCRGKHVWAAILAVLLPLVPCFILTSTVPSVWCLVLIFGGVMLLLLTASVRRHDPEEAPRLTARLLLPVLLAVAVLFLAVPQESYVNPVEAYQDQILAALGLQYGDGDGGSGEIDSVDLKALGARFYLPYDVMQVTSTAGGTLYLRERDFNSYDGVSWTSPDPRRTAVFSAGLTQGVSATVSIRTEWYRPQILLPYYPDEAATLTMGQLPNEEEDLTYDWAVTMLYEDWKDSIPNEQPALIEGSVGVLHYSSLPEETMLWAQEVLDGVLTDEQSATAIADTVAAFVRDSAVYENDCKRMPSEEEDFVRWFVESGESGYCTHFATSTAVLLRAAGVQSRYVTGYMVETTADEPVMITADKAHAWVEYYEPYLGQWIVLESTPAQPERTEAETTQTTTATTLPTNGGETLSTTVTTLPVGEGDTPVKGGFVLPKEVKAALSAVGVILLVVGTLEGQRRWRLRCRQNKRQTANVNEQALLLYTEAEKLSWLIDEPLPEALYAVAQKAKFSQHTLKEDELTRFAVYCQEARGQLKKRPWHWRFVYRYIFAYGE